MVCTQLHYLQHTGCVHVSVLVPEDVPGAQPNGLVVVYVTTNRGIHPLFLTAPPGCCHRAFECYDAAENESRLSARRDECFTERVKFALNESAGPVSALLCAATAKRAKRRVSVTAAEKCGDYINRWGARAHWLRCEV